MGKCTGHRKRVTVLYLALLTTAIFVRRLSAQSDVAVIVNPQNPISNVSLIDLRKIFSGEKHTWSNGTRVKLIVRTPGSHERRTLLRILGMSESEYKQYWTGQIFSGEADGEPLMVPSFGMTKEATKTFLGGIAFVEAQDLKPGMDIKVIKVDGRLPGESTYPLH